MSFSDYLKKRLADQLNERRIVVWYDAGRDFEAFAAAFKAPNCTVLSAKESILKTRRQADEIYRLMNESEKPAERDRCLLIYIVSRRRGATEDERMRDPFEVYALAGMAFGDTEDEKLESLARTAMPEKAEEIRRLFTEGRPDIALLDTLGQTQHWPVVRKLFNTESPADVIALALCDDSKAKAVEDTPGCVDEILRLLEVSVGFKASGKSRKWQSIRTKATEYVLFSEFAFDLPASVPEALMAVPRAPEGAKRIVYDACDRMRSDTSLREMYMDLAQRVEGDLRLPEVTPADLDLGHRDTFPFEERRLLVCAVECATTGDLPRARAILDDRKRSIWRLESQRSPAWTTLERAAALLDSAAKVMDELRRKKDLGGLVKAYVSGGWSELDRHQRLFETSFTACSEEEALAPLVDLCRRRWGDAALRLQESFLSAAQAEGWPPDGAPRQTRIFDEHVAPVLEQRDKVAFFLVDSLRYEMGQDLGQALSRFGEAEVRHAAAVIPTVTGSGMAALMPGADGMLRLVEKAGCLVPALGGRLLKTSDDRMKLLSEKYGDRFHHTTLDELLSSFKRVSKKLQNVDLLVIRTNDPDNMAENLGGWRARRYLSDVIGDIATVVKSLSSVGFTRVVISADHGHVMLPEILPGDVVQGPPGGWLENKRRCLLGAGLVGGPGTVAIKADHVGIQGDAEEICLPIGFRVFCDGEGYMHGGLSLQEAIVPVVLFTSVRGTGPVPGKPDIDILYRSDSFTSRVIGLKLHLRGDIFGTPAVVRIEAYDGSGAKAALIGDAADCEARDDKTHEVTLQANKETPVPVLIAPDFDGPEVEIRVSDPLTRVFWARRKLKNAMMG